MASSMTLRLTSGPQPLPQSGNGQSRSTAQWSHALTADPTQQAYIVHAHLNPTAKWHVCTKTEAIYHQETGYAVWRVVDCRKVVFRRREGDQNAAFAKQFEDIVEQERVLERAGVKVGRDEGVMDDVDDHGDGASDDDEMYSDVFDTPIESTETVLSLGCHRLVAPRSRRQITKMQTRRSGLYTWGSAFWNIHH